MIKFIFRWAFRFLILAIVLVVALLLLKDQIVTSIVEARVRKSTGMEVKIGAIHTSLTRPVFSVENFVLYNTAEFGGGIFLDIPDLHLEFYPDAARKQELHFKLARVNVRELNIVESKDGKTNILQVSTALQRAQGARGSNDLAFTFKGIDTLNLTVGKLRSLNLRAPNRNQELNLALQNEIVPNVRTWDDMAGILLKVVVRAGFTLYFDQPSRSTNNVPRKR